MEQKKFNIWWGPPKKFSTQLEERKISWLELFYDLVYVIVISRITHHMAVHPDVHGISQYIYLFTMVFWGWQNGSQYHDLHGSPGIRTRFMTLWQMIIVAALGVAMESPPETFVSRTIICFALLQFFITYLWWSVGIYDKVHRRLSVPYVSCYFLCFLMFVAALYIPSPYTERFLWLILIINHLPPLLNYRRLRSRNSEFSLSMSMVERLGLFTIIVFGENILGVINGVDSYVHLNASIWFCFALGILIVFALWWIFFALIADRECKHGFLAGQSLVFLYIPCLGSLGIVGATFSVLLSGMLNPDADWYRARVMFVVSLAVFLWSVLGISNKLIYDDEYLKAKKIIQPLLGLTGIVIVLLSLFFNFLSVMNLLIIIFLVLMTIIIVITRSWFKVELQHMSEDRNDK
ncbi:MAG: low temperature requirement protein A [Bacteroidota bacterium]